MSESLADRIKRHEGLMLHPKPDAKGAWVIGYGHDIAESEASNYPNGCSLEDAENWLDADIQKATDGVNTALPWCVDLDDVRREVLYELAFWIGLHGLTRFTRMLHAIETGDWNSAYNELIGSLLYDQIPKRTEELAEILLNDY